MTEKFSGKVGGKKDPASITHTFSVGAEGPLSVNLSFGGKATVAYTVYDARGAMLASGDARGSNSATAIPAGAYTIVVTALSGQASYTLTVTHY